MENKGNFYGEIDLSSKGEYYYNDYLNGGVLKLTLSEQREPGAWLTMRIKGGLLNQIPGGWNHSGDNISNNSQKVNEITILYVSDNDIRINVNVFDLVSKENILYIIATQSNGGDNSLSPLTMYPTGRIDHSYLPSFLQGTQTNIYYWDGTQFSTFSHPSGEEWGWINHFLFKNKQKYGSCNFYKLGKGGCQLKPGGTPYPSYPRSTFLSNAKDAWDEFKSNNVNPKIKMVFNHGYTSSLTEDLAYNYAKELEDFFAEIRDHFNMQELPIIYNSLSKNATGATNQPVIVDQQIKVGGSNNHLVMFDNIDYFDPAHISHKSAESCADRFFNKCIEL